MLRSGTNSLRVETGRWKKEPLDKRVCDICLSKDQVEDEMHFLLDCSVYNVAREQMYDEIFRATGHKLDVRWMKDNRTWTMDVLLGHGLKTFRQETLKAVMRFLTHASRIRKEYSGNRR